MMKKLLPLSCSVIAALMLLTGCISLKTKHEAELKPVEIKPIEININIRLTIDRELEDVFGDLDARDPALKKDPGDNAKADAQPRPR